MDFGLAVGLGIGVELTKEADDLIGFEMDAFDRVILTATFDGGPFDDAGGSGAEGIAHVRLLKDFVGAGAGAAGVKELSGSEEFVLRAVDDVEETEIDGVGESDAEIQIPGRGDGCRVSGVGGGGGG